jgi:hypothetical protein
LCYWTYKKTVRFQLNTSTLFCLEKWRHVSAWDVIIRPALQQF